MIPRAVTPCTWRSISVSKATSGGSNSINLGFAASPKQGYVTEHVWTFDPSWYTGWMLTDRIGCLCVVAHQGRHTQQGKTIDSLSLIYGTGSQFACMHKRAMHRTSFRLADVRLRSETVTSGEPSSCAKLAQLVPLCCITSLSLE